jgi:hypothetical protein
VIAPAQPVNLLVSFLRGIQKAQKVVAHREGRTRSLQITMGVNPPKSLTLYPIELGGH